MFDTIYWYGGLGVLNFVVPMMIGAICTGAAVWRQISIQENGKQGIIYASAAYSAGTWFGTSYIADRQAWSFLGFALGGLFVSLWLARHTHPHPPAK